jgi:hypothetical protein
MTYDEFQAAVQSYTHRSDQGATEWLTWFSLAESRIWRSLRSAANEQTAPVVIAGAPVAVPAEFRAMKNVIRLGTGKPVALSTWGILSAVVPNAGGFSVAAICAVNAGLFDVRARIDDTYNLTFWGALPGLTSTQQSNAVGDAHPELYVFALLAEALKWERDASASMDQVAQFDGAIEVINGAANADRW